MHVLQPVLRSSQRFNLNRTVRVPECLRIPVPSVRSHGLQYRAQHDNHRPHKEYFQVPGQEPRPDFTPYTRDPAPKSPIRPIPQPSSIDTNTATVQDASKQQSQPRSAGWVRVQRFVRSILWSLVFLQMGVLGGTALVTWDYMSPPLEPGSEEEQEFVDEILDILDTHPMVQDLRENEWVEIDAFTPDLQHGLKGKNLVHQVLGGNNTQGVFLKVFHHPTQEFTMLVFFYGFGVEGWPDIIHGGTSATLLQESLTKHMSHYYPNCLVTPDSSIKIDYKIPCKPGDVYGILVAPSGTKPTTVGNVHLTQLQLTGLLVQLAGAPVVNSEYDLESNTENLTIGIPTQNGQNPTFAMCQAQVKIVPKQLNPYGQVFEIGAKDDDGFARALDILKKRPEFKNTPSQTSTDEDKSEKE